MKLNTKTGPVLLAFSLMTLGANQALAHHRGYGYERSPITTQQQVAAQKIYDDYYSRTSALRQQLASRCYEYNALLSASSPDSARINAVAKEMETLRQSLAEQLVKRDVEMARAGVPRGTRCDDHEHRGGGHMMEYW